MSNINDPNTDEQQHKHTDGDGPSWGGVIIGLLLGIAGIVLIFYRYNQFHSTTGESIGITRIEMLIYKVAGEGLWALIAAYVAISLIGFYLAISNYTKMRKLK